jgi:hypothetical protein
VLMNQEAVNAAMWHLTSTACKGCGRMFKRERMRLSSETLAGFVISIDCRCGFVSTALVSLNGPSGSVDREHLESCFKLDGLGGEGNG